MRVVDLTGRERMALVIMTVVWLTAGALMVVLIGGWTGDPADSDYVSRGWTLWALLPWTAGVMTGTTVVRSIIAARQRPDDDWSVILPDGQEWTDGDVVIRDINDE